MFRKSSLLTTVLTVFCLVSGFQVSSQAQASSQGQTPGSGQQYVNAHVFTQPNDNENAYYWIRSISDPFWGISGFMYISAGSNTYYVQPEAISVISSSDAIISATVTVGNDQTPGYLQAEVWMSGGVIYAGYAVTDLLDSSNILDFSPGTPISGRGYMRIKK